MENKKTKLTISGNPKNKIRSFQNNKSKNQKTVFIDKHPDRSIKKASFSKSFGSKSNSSNFKKIILLIINFRLKYRQYKLILKDVNLLNKGLPKD